MKNQHSNSSLKLPNAPGTGVNLQIATLNTGTVLQQPLDQLPDEMYWNLMPLLNLPRIRIMQKWNMAGIPRTHPGGGELLLITLDDIPVVEFGLALNKSAAGPMWNYLMLQSKTTFLFKTALLTPPSQPPWLITLLYPGAITLLDKQLDRLECFAVCWALTHLRYEIEFN